MSCGEDGSGKCTGRAFRRDRFRLLGNAIRSCKVLYPDPYRHEWPGLFDTASLTTGCWLAAFLWCSLGGLSETGTLDPARIAGPCLLGERTLQVRHWVHAVNIGETRRVIHSLAVVKVVT